MSSAPGRPPDTLASRVPIEKDARSIRRAVALAATGVLFWPVSSRPKNSGTGRLSRTRNAPASVPATNRLAGAMPVSA
ncbi:hypothetical protein P0F65_21500 [Sphingomonas sp. I4]